MPRHLEFESDVFLVMQSAIPKEGPPIRRQSEIYMPIASLTRRGSGEDQKSSVFNMPCDIPAKGLGMKRSNVFGDFDASN